MKPTALIVTTTNWVPTARLALANAGFSVKALCPPRHPVSQTQAASRTHTYQALAPLPLRSWLRAIAAAKRRSRKQSLWYSRRDRNQETVGASAVGTVTGSSKSNVAARIAAR